MSRHHDKTIRAAQQAAAAVGQPRPRTEPRTPAERESFLRGFGLTGPALRQITEAWSEDTRLAYTTGHDEGYEAAACC